MQKAVFSSIFFVLCTHLLLGQSFQERAEANLPYLIRDSVLLDQLEMDGQGVSMYASAEDRESGQPEAVIKWEEVPVFLQMLEQLPFDESIQHYLAKGNANFPKDMPKEEPIRKLPKDFKKVKIALDPGHNANRFENALIERKYMRIKGEDLGQKKDVQFFEAELTYETAVLLKKRLKEVGAKVMISRKKGRSAAGPNFDKWLNRCKNKDLKRDLRKEKIDRNQYNWYRDTASNAQLFRYYFNRKDLQARADKINAWKPDLTLIIHYNASGANPVEGYFKPTEKNYGMMFVGGGFMTKELSTPEARVHFLRLLLSNDLKHSVELSDQIMQAHVSVLNVPTVANENGIRYLNRSSVYADKPGVYSRNLSLTRSIMGAICFGESFLQDNGFEAKQLVKENYRVGKIKTARRIGLAVEAYYEGVMHYLELVGEEE